jgi:hypothetical protein
MIIFKIKPSVNKPWHRSSSALPQSDVHGARALDVLHTFISQRRQIQTVESVQKTHVVELNKLGEGGKRQKEASNQIDAERAPLRSASITQNSKLTLGIPTRRLATHKRGRAGIH